MMYPKLNLIPILFAGILAITSCGSTSNNVFGQVEDDVYFSKKETHKKAVYVPEVDVKEIIKDNPPQYGEPNNPKQYNEYNGNGSSGFNYDEYNARQNAQSYSLQNEPEQSEPFLSTVPYAGQEEEAAEASRLRQQYYGNYNTYNYNYNTYYNDPYYDPFYNNYRYNSWYYPSTTIGLGWNSWGGWGLGVGVGWGWRSGWGYGWPHYNSYWGGPYGCNTWGWPYYGYSGWGWNSWCGPGYYPARNWGYSGYVERAEPRAQRPRQSIGSGMPRGENYQPRANGIQTPSSGTQPRNMPRSANQGQLINRDGQQIYVAPEQSRTMPRSYNSYNRSVDNAESQRQATPSSQQPRSVPRTYNKQDQPAQYNRTPNTQPSQAQPRSAPRSYRQDQPAQYNRTPNTQPSQAQPQPRIMPRQSAPVHSAPSAPQPRNYSPAPSSPAPSAPSGGGGGRSGSMPRPRR